MDVAHAQRTIVACAVVDLAVATDRRRRTRRRQVERHRDQVAAARAAELEHAGTSRSAELETEDPRRGRQPIRMGLSKREVAVRDLVVWFDSVTIRTWSETFDEVVFHGRETRRYGGDNAGTSIRRERTRTTRHRESERRAQRTLRSTGHRVATWPFTNYARRF